MKRFWCFIILSCFAFPAFAIAADTAESGPAVPPAPAPIDIVTLRDGSVIYGKILEMTEGVLHIKTPVSPDKSSKSNGAT
ncbi:MAG TPA: hypothetical protein VIU63_09905 [Nitrospira sp.]